ncbi:Uncharacterized protein SCF082_LOCUS35021, partial [Durusdinium trenchii]
MGRCRTLAWMLVVLGVCAGSTGAALAAPIDDARARVMASFTQKPEARIALDPAIVEGPWEPVPFDQSAYTFTFAEMKARWPEFMRGLRIPYPTADYLRERYQRFPALMHELGYQDDDWEMHSLNVQEVWQAFFRGDFRKARDLGIEYGGYAQVPGVFAQILQAIYLAKTHEKKQMLLQDDEPVPVMLANGYAPLVINAANEALAIQPDHPLVLAMNAVFDANVIRRVGKTAGRIALGAEPVNASELLDRSLAEVDDMAITQYEFANSLLYIDQRSATEQALTHLQKAATLKGSFSMEVLDAMYAQKRLAEVKALHDSG